MLQRLGTWQSTRKVTPVTAAGWHDSLLVSRADSRIAPSQWETALLCNSVSHWLGASLESALSKLILQSLPYFIQVWKHWGLMTPCGDINLVQNVFTKWLTTPRHYTSQCWFTINDTLWHSPVWHFTGYTPNISKIYFETTHWKLPLHFPRVSELMKLLIAHRI